MEVAIDHDNCGNCQLCIEACSEVFDIQLGEVVILFEDVPPEFQVDCRLAAEVCPTEAIEIREAVEIL